MTVNEKLEALREQMTQHHVDALIIPSFDPHQSEYIASHWAERAWISGFTGSAGTVVITLHHAGLWTDSRYFIQGEMELQGTEFTLHKMTNQFGTPYVDFILQHLPPHAVVAFNGWMFSKSTADNMIKTFASNQIMIQHRLDLISMIWTNRPSLSKAPIEYHDVLYSGKSCSEKLEELRQVMSTNNVQHYLISALDDLAWIFNIRGNDVEYNPVVIGYGLISVNTAQLFVDLDKITPEMKKYFKSFNINLHPYSDIVKVLHNLSSKDKILIDSNQCSYTLYEAINASVVKGNSIIKLLKAVKNETEIQHIRHVMKKDGAAIAETFYWLSNQLNEGYTINEVAVAQKLAERRSSKPAYKGESFGAIIGYKENGAIIHYHPMPDTCKTIHAEGILLVDSGGQYSDGTTDITRTLTLGPPTPAQMKNYTLVLKGMIALSKAVFPEGTNGGQMDILARQYLWAFGLNFAHGTGHGVGFFLNVHEPPQGFAPAASERSRTAHVQGMLSSNEPGFYVEGEYGMRIENLIIAQKASFEGFLCFETVTLYPFEHALIDASLLTSAEVGWINDYHLRVLESVSPHIDSDEVKIWFAHQCRPI